MGKKDVLVVDNLVPYLMNMFNQVANSKLFPKELLEAIIITIPKSGKDPSTPCTIDPYHY